MKDRFSFHSQDYAQYRPGYPPELFAYLRKMVSTKERAWDCGTGSGQVAGELARSRYIFSRCCGTGKKHST